MVKREIIVSVLALHTGQQVIEESALLIALELYSAQSKKSAP